MAVSPTPRPRDCPACGAMTRHGFLYAKQGCDVLRCDGCGLGRAETAAFDPATYYGDDYFSGGRLDGYADYVASAPVLHREFARDVDFVRRFRRGGRLLEIGCAYGYFLDEAKHHFDVAGIEIAEAAAADCRRRGLNVLTGVATPEMLAGLGRFDVIVMLDVIEHLPDPQATLALCADHLTAGGVIVLTTGDFGSPLARWAGAGWRLMTPPQHLWFFTHASMQRMAAHLALSVQSFDHPWKIVPLSLILFQLARMIGRPAVVRALGAGVAVPVNLFDAMRVVLRRGDAA